MSLLMLTLSPSPPNAVARHHGEKDVDKALGRGTSNAHDSCALQRINTTGDMSAGNRGRLIVGGSSVVMRASLSKDARLVRRVILHSAPRVCARNCGKGTRARRAARRQCFRHCRGRRREGGERLTATAASIGQLCRTRSLLQINVAAKCDGQTEPRDLQRHLCGK